MNTTEKTELQTFLQGKNGADQIYKTKIINNYFYYTDGVKYLAEKASAYWLIQLIAVTLQTNKVALSDSFLCIKLKVKNESGFLSIEDGNDNVYEIVKISYTDFPLDELRLFYCNSVEGNKPIKLLMLPAEY